MKIPRIILSIILCSLCYWLYLSFNTRMEIVNDALSYKALGHLLHEKGYIEYFKTGPNREPLYPSLVAISIYLQNITGKSYTQIMALIGVLILLSNQLLVFKALTILNVRTSIIAICLAYLGLSPAINNTAFSLYSEIATYPFILLLILSLSHVFKNIQQKCSLKTSLLMGSWLGALLLSCTLIKSIFEIIAVIIISLFIVLLFKALLEKDKNQTIKVFVLLLSLCGTYLSLIHTYKSLNQKYNGNYSITDRGAWAFYGSCALRAEPLDLHHFLTALAHIPGKGACSKFFSDNDCNYWEPQHSDAFGMPKLGEVSQVTPPQEVNKTMMKLAKEKIMEKPHQFALFALIDGIKMFFWESTQIGFVQYPPWLEKLYATGLFKDILRLLTSLLSLSAFIFLGIHALRLGAQTIVSRLSLSLKDCLLLTLFFIVFFYISLYALFNTVPRFALPIAPLLLINIAFTINQLYNYFYANKQHPSTK